MKHTCVVDIGYGDGGKGVLVDRLCAVGDVGLVVRFNGGCQAAHNVVQDDGRHHTFAQLGSGTFHRVPTYLASPVMVEPLSMVVEAEALAPLVGFDPLDLVSVSLECRLTTPYHWIVNRWLEDQRGDARHGSTGRGVGMTAKFAEEYPAFTPHVYDIADEVALRDKLAVLRAWCLRETRGEARSLLPDTDELVTRYQTWERRVTLRYEFPRDDRRIVFEGAQGVLLDEHYGFHPYTTWSTVTPGWVRDACESFPPGDDELEVIGVTRAYSTRHGAGPFVPEDNALNLPEAHNKHEHYQGGWRVGHLDAPALDYAIKACQGIDAVYVTHVDTAEKEPRLQWCGGYDLDGMPLRIVSYMSHDMANRECQSEYLKRARPVLHDRPYADWAESVAEILGVPLAGRGYGPRTCDGAFTALTP